ncbi:MAG: thioredoxin domain-containing protein [Deltaproteobacteria bacterium]|nr:thioredoxin domain-containing protein [Deltaproteobacteria bacterium]
MLALGNARCRCESAASRAPERALPGAPALPEALRVQLHEVAAARRAAGTPPRTRHVDASGAPLYVNRLALETSPYLLQHAHNPVSWWPWGEAAFAEARRLNRPVLLSVGYSTCHWCHVMEEESFDDEATARELNQRYIAIKVDREVRPDLDAVYMSVVSMLHGSGGWPMTVWLTPERRPFHAGTYFPGTAQPGRPAFRTVLAALADEYARAPDTARGRAAELTAALAATPPRPAGAAAGAAAPDALLLATAAGQIAAGFDPLWGGLRGAPKFPQPAMLALLLRHARRTTDPVPLTLALRSLERMATGGIHDQLGGGFHRYSTDEQWLKPHFEKMLYDNAQLALVYLEGAQAGGRAELLAWALDTLDCMARDFMAPEGLLYAALDADTAGDEGATYLWTPEEVDAVVGPERGALLRRVYGVEARGSFDARRSVLILGAEGVAATTGGLAPELARALTEGRAALLAARARRAQPAVDRKRLTGWNALAISAFARAAAVDARYLALAQRAGRELWQRAYVDHGDRLAQHLAPGPQGGLRASGEAFLDDHALLLAAMLDLFEADADPRWLAAARTLAGALEAFADPAGGWYTTSARHEASFAGVRVHPEHDGALPGGDSVAALALLRLAALTDDHTPRARALAALAAEAGTLAARPLSRPAMLLALDFATARVKQLVLVTPDDPARATAALAPFRQVLALRFLPAHVQVTVRAADVAALARALPLLADRSTTPDAVTAYVCIDTACELPTSDPAVFARQLDAP